MDNKFSDKKKTTKKPLNSTQTFLLSDEVLAVFNILKSFLVNVGLTTISDNLLFVKTDASHNSISAVLSQDNYPVASYSRSHL